MFRRFTVCAALVAAALVPIHASAGDWFARGFAGASVGGQVVDAPKSVFGAAVGWFGPRVIGFEVDASHTSDFFQVQDVPDVLLSKSSVTTLMFNGVYGLRRGAADARLQPYVSGGAGWLRARIGADTDFVQARGNHLGVDIGAGATAMFSPRWGIGGDLRYFRDLQDLEGESEFFNQSEHKIDFWRATATLMVRF